MSKLVRFLDGAAGVSSRVDLDNGDPIFISVAQAGILVKRSKMGILGAKLFEVSNVNEAARTAMLLDSQIAEYNTPVAMQNPVLKAFTQIALESKSASELSVRLNEAFREAKAT